ncbi:MAG TPA: hypothetical protein VL026_08355, partial [Rhizomicrobium sp.]|nr:hypothetical protein [Rhizomicrobium sp.]
TRLKTHLIKLGEWDEARHTAQAAEVVEDVRAANAQAESHGTLGSGNTPDVTTMFEDVYEQMPWHLVQQRAELGH